jgi:hypothetical protein
MYVIRRRVQSLSELYGMDGPVKKILISVRLCASEGETLRKLHVYFNIGAIKVAKLNNFGLSNFTK